VARMALRRPHNWTPYGVAPEVSRTTLSFKYLARKRARVQSSPGAIVILRTPRSRWGAEAHSESTTLLTIHACLPTWRPRVNPNFSRSSTVALNRKWPGASRPVVTSEMASTGPPPA